MNKINSYLLIAAALLLISSCKKDPVETPDPVLPSPSERVLVSCEGGYLANNGSLASYNTSTSEAVVNVFEGINGYGLGDVFQSMTAFDEKLYLVVNNSAKIEVVNELSLTAESPITGLQSPRVMLLVSSDKAYVTNLGNTNEVQVVDLNSRTVSGTIDVGGESEGMKLVNDEVFVARNSGSKLMVVNADTDLVVDSIEVGSGPLDIIQDSNGNLWVICIGFDASFNVIDAHLTKVNPASREVLGTYAIPEPWSYNMVLGIDAMTDKLIILNNNVYQMGVSDTSISNTALIIDTVEDQTNYGLGVDPSNGDIYIGSVDDFSSPGFVYRYDSAGALIDDFEVGIAPNGFYFGQ